MLELRSEGSDRFIKVSIRGKIHPGNRNNKHKDLEGERLGM